VRPSRASSESVRQKVLTACDSSPGFHEVLDFFACPFAVIQVLDDGVISSCAGDISVLHTQLKNKQKIHKTHSSNFTKVTLNTQAMNPHRAT